MSVDLAWVVSRLEYDRLPSDHGEVGELRVEWDMASTNCLIPSHTWRNCKGGGESSDGGGEGSDGGGEGSDDGGEGSDGGSHTSWCPSIWPRTSCRSISDSCESLAWIS